MTMTMVNEKASFSGINNTVSNSISNTVSNGISNAVSNVKATIVTYIAALATFYSAILEEPVSNAKALHIFHVQVSFCAFLLAGCFSLVACLLCLAWFVVALKK